MNKTILITGAIAGLLAVLLGAFGAHGLKNLVALESIHSYNTGVRYQMYHAIVCLILGNMSNINSSSKKHIFYFFVSGIILFSGSIYLLVIDQIIGVNLSSFGFITPLGGLLLIIGWIMLVISIIKIK